MLPGELTKADAVVALEGAFWGARALLQALRGLLNPKP